MNNTNDMTAEQLARLAVAVHFSNALTTVGSIAPAVNLEDLADAELCDLLADIIKAASALGEFERRLRVTLQQRRTGTDAEVEAAKFP